jgi:APA family basic amino acid/polyamine antiporter
MLGGIFPTIGAGAHAAGPALVISFALTGFICLCVALCYAEFASMVPVAGSAYTYAYATLGEFIAWVIGWDLILEYGLSVAPTASSWSAFAQQLLGNLGVTLPARLQSSTYSTTDRWPFVAYHPQFDLIAGLIALAVTALVAVGIRESARANTALVVFQIATMVVFLAALAGAVHGSNLHPFAPHGWNGIIAGGALAFYAYIGFDTVTVASEEASNPVRDVPIGILLSLVLGGILYAALSFVTVGVMPYAKLSEGAAMLDAVHGAHASRAVYWIVGLGGLAGNTTVMLTSLLGQIRIFYVMARDRMLPPGVARIHPRFRTPARTTMITGILVAILASVLPLTDLLNFVNIGTLSAFAIVCIGVLVLRAVEPHAARPFRAPLGSIFAILGAGGCLYLMTGGLSKATWLRFATWFVLGLIAYALFGYRHSRLRAAGRD